MNKIKFCGHKKIIHHKLKELRVKAGLSQRDLAAKMQLMNVSMDQQMISKIEKNTRMVTDYELVCLCSILHIEVQELLGEFEAIYEKSRE